MSLEELERKRLKIKQNSDITLNNMQKIANESYRVAEVAHDSKKILENLDCEFERQTGLGAQDVKFLFLATGLQVARIVIINELTKIEKAGSGNRNENELHEFQEWIMEKFSDDSLAIEKPYYASKEHIITTLGVPYDATMTLTEKSIQSLLKKNRDWDFDIESFIPTEKLKLFGGGNHRFATLGHDPILGLLFGTANIMTNTITCVKTPINVGGVGIPVLTTNHVIYSSDFKDPRIGTYGSTSIMLKEAVERAKAQPSAMIAALIKQIIHIGTDLYTPCGIQIPAANLVLSNTKVEEITKYVSTGDLIKIGVSAKLSELINLLISSIHCLLYNPESGVSRDVYNVKTRKIITYSNLIATTSNVVWVGGNMMAGNEMSVKNLDLGGLVVTVNRLLKDPQYIRKVKEEFIFNEFNKKIRGEELDLEDIVWD